MSNNTPPLPQRGFVRLPTILKMIPVGRSTWWAGVKQGRFPKPVKLGENTTAWRVEDIQALIQTINAGKVGGSTELAAANSTAGTPAQGEVQYASEWVKRLAREND